VDPLTVGCLAFAAASVGVGGYLFWRGGRAPGAESVLQVTLDQLPVAAAVAGHGHAIRYQNALWASDFAPVLKDQNYEAFAAALRAADAQQQPVPVEQTSETHLLQARRLTGSRRLFLVTASRREPNVHPAEMLKTLAHDAGKRWREIAPYVEDTCTNGVRSSYLHNAWRLMNVRATALALGEALEPLETLLASQHWPPERLRLCDLLQDITSRGLAVRVTGVTWAEPQLEKRLHVQVRPDSIRYVFEQLAENARRHGDSDAARIHVEVTSPPPAAAPELRRWVHVHFLDNGTKGFDTMALSYVQQQRQVPRENSAQLVEFGLGCGLLICRAFAKQNLGTLELVDSATAGGPPGLWFDATTPGVRATLALPVESVGPEAAPAEPVPERAAPERAMSQAV
jgi:hypothetical protein